MQSHPSFMTCKRCNTVQWFTVEYLNHYKAGVCRNCRANDWRPSNVYPTLRERAYLLRMWLWQTWYVNRRGVEGGDPHWYLKPWLVAQVVWMGLTIMRQYNAVSLGGDRECPRNIETMRAELSRGDASADPCVSDATRVLSRQRGNPV